MISLQCLRFLNNMSLTCLLGALTLVLLLKFQYNIHPTYFHCPRTTTAHLDATLGKDINDEVQFIQSTPCYN